MEELLKISNELTLKYPDIKLSFSRENSSTIKFQNIKILLVIDQKNRIKYTKYKLYGLIGDIFLKKNKEKLFINSLEEILKRYSYKYISINMNDI